MRTSQRPHAAVRWLLVMLMAFAIHASAAIWKEKVLYSFQGGSDGAVPAGGVVFDRSGNLYGATTDGNQYGELGVVYELSPPAKKGDPWTESLIYQFLGKKDYNDGMNPVGGLVIDSSGNLYGTTAYGGTGGCILLGVLYGCGTVYELSPPQQKGGQWTETILYSFQSGKDGYFPWGPLTFDSKGNLYGATQFGGGKGNTCDPYYQYCGTVFELRPPKQKGGEWTEKVLHSFGGGNDGTNPNGGLLLDSKGTVYGTTVFGGQEGGECGGVGCGTVFELTPPGRRGGPWKEKLLLQFNGQDGAEPEAGVIFGKDGNLYGTASGGGPDGYGGIVELARAKGKSRTWKENILYLFNGTSGGVSPRGGLIFGARGYLYGTTDWGSGSESAGSVFRLKPQEKGGIWTIDYLHGFVKVPDGLYPEANLTMDEHGDLYSTTQEGGSGTACGHGGCGTIFEVLH